MENNDSNRPQQTGGLKLMTVFIAVLALHVVVIGGFTVYHLMSGGTTDTDLLTDKTHKGLKDGSLISDGSLPDATQGDKGPTPGASTEIANIPSTSITSVAPTVTAPPAATPTPAQDQATPTDSANPTTSPILAPPSMPPLNPSPAPTSSVASGPLLAPPPETAPMTPPPASLSTMPPPEVANKFAPSSSAPPVSEMATTPATIAPVPAPSATPELAGPVHMPATPAPTPVKKQIYVVKITDSYKKIAKAHHVTVAELKEANGIKNNVLHTGQKLIIPSTQTEVALSTSLDTAPSGPIVNDAAPTAMLTSTQPTSLSRHHIYTVVKGDTLTRIAHRFKTTTTALMEANDITDPTKLSIGKKLRIPSRESRSAGNNVSSPTQPGQVQAKSTVTTAQLANYVH